MKGPAIYTMLACLLAACAYGQPGSVRFDVASIKPCSGDGPPGTMSASPGRLVVNCMNVMGLINQAYVMYANGSMNLLGARLMQFEKAPAWLRSERFSIEAAAGSAMPPGMMRGPMLAALLQERFQLKMHTEVREVNVYNLTAAKGGAKLQRHAEGSCTAFDFDHPPVITPGKALGPLCKLTRITPDSYDLRAVTMAEFGVDLARGLDREVIDKTGLSGEFDIHVDLAGRGNQLLTAPAAPPAGGAVPPVAPPQQADPQETFSAIQAIVQKLGLRLESGRGPARFLVIDRVERPPAN